MGRDVVARYFFQFSDGKRIFSDSSGIELNGVAAARSHAAVQIRDMRDTMSKQAHLDLSGWKMIVVDIEGTIVFEIGFDFRPVI